MSFFAFALPLSLAVCALAAPAPTAATSDVPLTQAPQDAIQFLAEGSKALGDSRWTDAIADLESAIAALRQAHDTTLEAKGWILLGGAYLGQSEYRRAVDAGNQAIALARQVSHAETEARALSFVGNVLAALELTDQARAYFEHSLVVAQAIGNRTLELSSLSDLINLAEHAGDMKASASALELMLPLARAEDDPERISWVLAHLGVARLRLGDLDAATDRFTEALARCEATRNVKAQVFLLHTLGNGYLRSGKIDEAKQISAKLLALARHTDDPVDLGKALELLALIETDEPDYQALLTTADQERQLALRVRSPAQEEHATAHEAVAAYHLGLPSAMDLYGKLASMARESGNQQHLTEALTMLAIDASLDGDHKKALDYADQLLAYARSRQDLKRQADSLCLVGAEKRALGRQEEAQTDLDECLRLSRQASYTMGTEAMGKMGIGQHQQGQPLVSESERQSIAISSEVLAEIGRQGARHDPDPATLAMLAAMGRTVRELEDLARFGPGGNLGDLPQECVRALLRDDPQAAHAAATKLHFLVSHAKDERLQDIALDLLILACAQRGTVEDFEQMLTLSRERLALARRRGDHRAEAQSIESLADAQILRGDLWAAASSAEQALSLARLKTNPTLEKASVDLLARAAYLREDDAAAIRWSEESLHLARLAGDLDRQAQALVNLGEARTRQGNVLGAVANCEAAAALDRPLSAFAALRCLVRGYIILHDVKQAHGAAVKLGEQARRLGDPDASAQAVEAQADVAMNLGTNAEAVALLTASARLRAGSRSDSGLRNAARDLGLAALLTADWRGASTYFERALALLRADHAFPVTGPETRQEAFLLADLSTAYLALGDKARALSAARELQRIARFAPDPADRAGVLTEVGRAQLFADDPAAVATLRQAIAAWEESRAALAMQARPEEVGLLDHEHVTYELLQQALIGAGEIDSAIEAAERGRARGFADLLTVRGTAGSAPFSIADARRLAQEKKLTLVEYSLVPTGLFLSPGADGVEPQLDRDLIIWVMTSTGSVTWKRVDLAAARRDPAQSLFALLHSLRQAVGGIERGVSVDGFTASQQILARLYQLLIAPIANRLPRDSAGRVAFIPDGPLALVPFAALRTPAGRYLIEDYTVLTAPSIQALILLPPPSDSPLPTGDDALVVGAPDIAAELRLEPYNLTALPGSLKEAKLIARVLRTLPLVGATATKDEVLHRLPRSRLVHLATHGILEKLGDPMIPGALVLAPGPHDNGVLTAREILGLKLHADLVVLSACDTAGGRLSSDGVLGLSRAFLTAGATALVGTLWSIPDEETSWMMSAFYQQLARQPDPVAALRQTMLAAIKVGREPRSWAGFTVVSGLR